MAKDNNINYKIGSKIQNPFETIMERYKFNPSQSRVEELGKIVEDAYSVEDKKEEEKEYNPFLDKDGNLLNEYIDYDKVLNDPGVSDNTKNYINKALFPQMFAGNKPWKKLLDYNSYSGNNENDFKFNADADVNNLASMDVVTELPKLSEAQISAIITKHFSKSPVIGPSDAKGIFDAQQTSGMSALAILGIGALESGYGTSSIARNKNNLWGWNATNVNPSGNAKSFSPVSQGALEFANSYLNTYYNKYGAKSIYSAGTGNNPAGKGYAYYDSGGINPSWATNVGSIMGTFYTTAIGVGSSNASYSNIKPTGNKIVDSASKYMGTKYVWGGKSLSAGGLDCSGLVYNAMKDSGNDIGLNNANGYYHGGTPINSKDLRAGDLVFYGSPNKATHVAIYIGNGKIIQSSGDDENTKDNPGRGVNISSLNHRSDYIGARRY